MNDEIIPCERNMNPIFHELTDTIEEEFWCHDCDFNKVKRNDKKTGKFFQIWGTQHGTEGEYHAVRFALCPECLAKRPDLTKI